VTERLKVIVTGATGMIGRTLMEDLAGVFELTGTSRRPQDDPRFVVLDFDDIDAIAAAFDGHDVVVHMHAKSNHNDDDFAAYLGPNVVGVYNMYEAARRAGVRRVVFASSNHATGWYEIVGERCDAESTVRPDGIYGAAKVWGEALGRHYSDRWGLEVIALRIGSYQYRQTPPQFEMGPRILSTWLSDRDLVDLVRRAIEAPDLRFGIYYGISANSRAYWDLTNAVSELGYRPHDDAEDYADEVLAKGGVYSLWGYTVAGMV
jgi:uronate dehydrogenase